MSASMIQFTWFRCTISSSVRTRSPTSKLSCGPPTPSRPSALAPVPLARTYLDADALLAQRAGTRCLRDFGRLKEATSSGSTSRFRPPKP